MKRYGAFVAGVIIFIASQIVMTTTDCNLVSVILFMIGGAATCLGAGYAIGTKDEKKG